MNVHVQDFPSSVLVVDDMPDARELLRTWLTMEGFDVAVAGNGVEALQLISEAKRPFCAVLTDMWMPEMSGAELVRVLRSRPATQLLPIIMISAGDGRGLPRQPGIDAFLGKPFDFPPLLHLLIELGCHPTQPDDEMPDAAGKALARH